MPSEHGVESPEMRKWQTLALPYSIPAPSSSSCLCFAIQPLIATVADPSAVAPPGHALLLPPLRTALELGIAGSPYSFPALRRDPGRVTGAAQALQLHI